MKIPRDISGKELAKLLEKFDYQITRQTGSHIRLAKTLPTEHHITIPEHSNLKIGTLNSILKSLAAHLKLDKQKLLERLFK